MIKPNIPLGSSAHFCNMGTENATVLPVPVREPPIQSRPLRISGIQAFWMPVGRLISMDASDATSQGATSMEAKLTLSVLIVGGDSIGSETARVDFVGSGALALTRDRPLATLDTTSGESFLLFLDPSCCCKISSSEDDPDSKKSSAISVSIVWCYGSTDLLTKVHRDLHRNFGQGSCR